MISLLPHLFVISGIPPNKLYGTGIIFRSLLGDYPPEKLTIATCGEFKEHLIELPDQGGLLQGEYLEFYRFRRYPRYLGRLLWVAKLLQITLALSWQILRRRGQCIMLAAPTGWRLGPDLFVAAYFASRLTRSPLIVYEMDDWRDTIGKDPERLHKDLERLFHVRILRAASQVWAVSQPMVERFQSRYGVSPRAMPSAVNVDRYFRHSQPRHVNTNSARLLFTGAVYGAQADALVNVLAALQLLTDIPCVLTIYTNDSPEDLASYGLSGPNLVVEKAVPIEEMPELLATADLLILPYSFREEERTVVSQSYPTKTADYLASGVPILVHAPPYATITRQALQDGWGEIVDVADAEVIVAAIRRLLNEGERRAELSARAREAALRDHDLLRRRAELISTVRNLAGLPER